MNNDNKSAHAIAIAISANLVGTWTVHQSEYCCTITRDDDGLELSISYDRAYNAPKDRLSISQNYHADAWRDGDGHRHDPTSYNERLPSINVTAKKTGKTIAKEIGRRLLPDCETFHARAVARVASSNASHSERDRLAIALGMDPATRSHYNGRTDNPTATHDIANGHQNSSYSRAEVTATSSGVDIKLRDLTAEQARTVLAAVGVELPAAARVAA